MSLQYVLCTVVLLDMCTVNSPNCGHFGTQASIAVLYSKSVLYLGVRVISSPICVVNTVIMLFDIKASRDII